MGGIKRPLISNRFENWPKMHLICRWFLQMQSWEATAGGSSNFSLGVRRPVAHLWLRSGSAWLAVCRTLWVTEAAASHLCDGWQMSLVMTIHNRYSDPEAVVFCSTQSWCGLKGKSLCFNCFLPVQCEDSVFRSLLIPLLSLRSAAANAELLFLFWVFMDVI